MKRSNKVSVRKSVSGKVNGRFFFRAENRIPLLLTFAGFFLASWYAFANSADKVRLSPGLNPYIYPSFSVSVLIFALFGLIGVFLIFKNKLR